jgi:biotin carboxylase
VTVLVLNHRQLDERPAGTWLKDAGELLMVTTRTALAGSPASERAAFARIVAVDSYASAEVEHAARALADRHKPARVVSSCELDLIRAACLRERYGLAGQDVTSALAFRDKLHMRQAAAAGGVAGPRFHAVQSVTGAADFAGQTGYPVVVKPRLGTGTEGITVAASHAELVRAATSPGPAGRGSGGLLAEEFISGPLFHVDGVSADGTVVHCWPSRYSQPVLQAVTRSEPRISVLLDARDPLRPRLQHFTRQVLAALPSAGAGFAFHLEAWSDAAGTPVLCEVTSRASTDRIVAAYNHAFGVNLCEEGLRLQAGLPLQLRQQPAAPARYAGWVVFPAAPGVFTPPPAARRPYALTFGLRLDAGARGRQPTSITDFAADAVIDGTSASQVTGRARDLAGWWTASRPWR